MRVMPPKGARSPKSEADGLGNLSPAFSRRTADYTDEYGSNGRCHPKSRMLSGRGTSHKHEAFSATMSILPKNDIVAGIDDPGNTGAARSENVSTQNNGAAVAGIAEPGAEDAKSAANDRGYNLPNSRKVYLSGEIRPDIRAPFRE